MKQIYKFLGAVAVAAMSFTGCSNDIDEISTPDANPEGLTLTLEVDANPANVTRTQMNEEGTNVIWSNPEKTNFYGDRKFLGKNVATQTMEGTKVHFTITLPSGTPAPKQLDGFFGAEYSGEASIFVNKEYSAFGIILPASQDVTAKTFDSSADALVMDTKTLEGVDLTQPISGISYNRLHAITKLMFKGAEAYAQDKVSKIEFTVSSKDIAGEFAYDYSQKTFVDKAGAAFAEPVFSVNPSKTITLKCSDQPLLDAQFATWMVMAAVELPQGETVTVKITTDKHIITKTLTIPAAAKFVSTKLNTLSVDLTGAQVEGLGAGQFSGDYVVMVYQKSKKGEYYHAVKAEEDGRSHLKYSDISFKPGDKTVDSSSIDPSLVWTIGGNDQTGYTFTNASVNKSWTIGADKQLPLGTPADSFTITVNEALNNKVQLPNYHITSAPNHYVGFNSSSSFFAIYDNPGNFLLKDFYLVPVKADTRTALATPEGQAKATGNSIYVTWSEVANAQNYTVKCGAETYTTTNAKEVEHTFEGLKWATDYEITIIANADPASKEFKDSEAWKSTPVTTEPDPTPAFTLSPDNLVFYDTVDGVDTAKDITVNITNNPQNLKIEAADTEHFTVVVAADNSKITVTPKAKVTADVLDEILTVKLGAATQVVKLTQKAFVEGAPQQMTIDLTTRNYGNTHDITTVVGTDPLSVVFDKAKGSNPPKYYVAAGGAVRMYIDNTLTIGISDSTKKITKIVIETNNGNTSSSGAALVYDKGQLDDTKDWTWENSAGVAEVKFTAIKFNKKNQVPVKAITVFYK